MQQWGLPSAGSESTGKTGKPDWYFTMSLVKITPMQMHHPDATYSGQSNDPLLASAELLNTANSGNNRELSGNRRENQLINAPPVSLAPSDVDIPLQLRGISVEQLTSYIHHINLLCSKRIRGDFVRPDIFPVILSLRTSPRLIVKVCNKGEVSTIPARMCVNVKAIDYVNDRTAKRNRFVSNVFRTGSSVYEIFRNYLRLFTPARDFKQWHTYEKNITGAGAEGVSLFFTVNAAKRQTAVSFRLVAPER
ncbi:DUF3251 domain-containing protein [Shigella flexneri]